MTSTGDTQILLVEDDEAHAALIEAALKEAPGYALHVTKSLTQANEFLRRQRPHIMFSDLMLKDGQGSELLPSNLELAEFPVILMTSFGSEATAVDVMKQGAFDYLIKSEQMFAEFPRIVERALREWRQVQMRNEAECALRRSEEHLRMALEAASVGTWEWDPNSDEIIYHVGAEDSLGVDPDSLRGSWSSYLELVKEEDRDEIISVMRNALADEASGRQAPYVVEHRVRRKDGETQWVQLQGRVVRDHENQPVRVAGTVVDITARKLAESKLRNTENQLAHITRVATMGEMLSGIAHELNHPLYTIKNYGKACSNLIANSEQVNLHQLQEWLGEICTMADHAGEMIRRMRNYVKKEPSKKEDVSVEQIIETSLSLVRFEAAKRGVQLTSKTPERSRIVCVDIVQIEQVLVNLIRNAFEAMHDSQISQPKVRVEVVERPAEIEIRILDNGPGIDHGETNIFDAFATTKPNGLGLGLAIARNLVEAHRGELVAENLPGGAVFSFTLPSRSVPQHESAASP